MIGDVILKYRLEHHLSQAEMAKKLEVSPSYISSLERGVRSVAGRPYQVSYPVLERLSKLTGISTEVLNKEMNVEETLFIIDTLNDEEIELICSFRKADGKTKAMIRRLLMYTKLLQELDEKGKSDK